MTPPPEPPGGARRGAVLGLVVLALIALELLAHGVLLLARQERAATSAGLRLLQARAAAEAAITRGLPAPFPGDADAVPLMGTLDGGSTRWGDVPTTLVLERAGREAWLATAHATLPGAGWGWRSGSLLWIPDPVARAGALPHAVVAGAEGVAAGAEAPPFRAGSAPSWCRPWAESLDSLLPPSGGAPVAAPPAAALAWPRLGRLDLPALAALLPRVPGGVVTPSPTVEGGGCRDEEANWGDPTDPAGPCGALQVTGFVEGDLVLAGGLGQGLLAVSGDLTLVDARFAGWLLAGGSVRLVGEARVEGQVLAGASFDADAGARVVWAPCRLARALDAAARWIRVPRPVPGAGALEGM